MVYPLIFTVVKHLTTRWRYALLKHGKRSEHLFTPIPARKEELRYYVIVLLSLLFSLHKVLLWLRLYAPQFHMRIKIYRKHQNILNDYIEEHYEQSALLHRQRLRSQFQKHQTLKCVSHIDNDNNHIRL